MHKVMRVKDYDMTRDVELLNVETGTVDYCFDYSVMYDDGNFEFIEIGKTYDCKISLLDFENSPKSGRTVEAQLVNPDVFIGEFAVMEIRIGKDTYYISKNDGEGLDFSGHLSFSFSRKDLIQVDHVIHPHRL